MGLSTRCPVDKDHLCGNVHNAESFFVESLEQWRKLMNLDTFYFVAHSFGGYIATCYSLKYQFHVEKLVLLSPAGFSRIPKDWDLHKYVTKFNGYVRQKLALGLCIIWDLYWSPFDAFRSLGYYVTAQVLEKYIQSRLNSIPIGHRQVFKEYLLGIFLSPGSGEYAVPAMLSSGGFGRKPLTDRIEGLKIPVTFVYGDRDWMDKKAAYEIQSKQLVKEVKVEILKESSH